SSPSCSAASDASPTKSARESEVDRGPDRCLFATSLARSQLHDVAGAAQRRVDGTGFLDAGGSAFLHVHDLPIGVQPEDVDGELAVLHPDAVEVWRLEEEEHAAVGSEGGTEHETHRTILVLHHDLDLQYLARG